LDVDTNEDASAAATTAPNACAPAGDSKNGGSNDVDSALAADTPADDLVYDGTPLTAYRVVDLQVSSQLQGKPLWPPIWTSSALSNRCLLAWLCNKLC
jgi:hypothetical protein